jgi:hypothetical protein
VGLAFGRVAGAQEEHAESAAESAPEKKVRAGETALDYRRSKGAEACPDEEELRLRSGAFFDDEDPFVESGVDAPGKVSIVISRAGGLYRGEIRLQVKGEAAGVTRVEGASCSDVVWTLAQAVHLIVARKPAAPCPVCPACKTCPAPPPPAPPVRVIEQRCDAACEENVKKKLCAQYGRCMGPTLSLMGGGLITLGWTLNVGPGLWLGGQVGWENFTIGVEARGMFPESMARSVDGGTLSDLVSFSGLVVPCARWKVLFGCAFVEAGNMIYTAPGRSDGKGDLSLFLFALGPRAGVDIPIAGGFSIRGFADLAIHPDLPRAHVTDGLDPNKTVHTVGVPLINGFASIGVAWNK